jgi:hypothetical protein
MTTDRMPDAAPPGPTQPLWRRKPWLIPLIVVLVAGY